MYFFFLIKIANIEEKKHIRIINIEKNKYTLL